MRFANPYLLWLLGLLLPIVAYYIYRAMQGGASIRFSSTAARACATPQTFRSPGHWIPTSDPARNATLPRSDPKNTSQNPSDIPSDGFLFASHTSPRAFVPYSLPCARGGALQGRRGCRHINARIPLPSEQKFIDFYMK